MVPSRLVAKRIGAAVGCRRPAQVLLLVSLFSFAPSGCDRRATEQRDSHHAPRPILSLMDQPSHVRLEMAVNGEQRPVLIATPPSQTVFSPVEIPSSTVLRFGVGVSQELWLREGDGMSFTLSIRTPERTEAVEIYSRYVDPKNILADQRWFDERISLADYAGRPVEFTLTNSVGASGDSRSDGGGWSGLEIVPGGLSPDSPSTTFHLFVFALLISLSGALVATLRSVIRIAPARFVWSFRWG